MVLVLTERRFAVLTDAYQGHVDPLAWYAQELLRGLELFFVCELG